METFEIRGLSFAYPEHTEYVIEDLSLTVHAGEFVVTTDRIVFIASSRAYEEKLSKISAVSADSGYLEIMTAKSNYAMRMPLPEYPCEIIKHCISVL